MVLSQWGTVKGEGSLSILMMPSILCARKEYIQALAEGIHEAATIALDTTKKISSPRHLPKC